MKLGRIVTRLMRTEAEAWRSLLMLFLIWTLFSLGFSRTLDGVEFERLWPLILLGLLFGWLLATSPISGRPSLLLSLLFIMALAVAQTGGILSRLADLASSWLDYLYHLVAGSSVSGSRELSVEWQELSQAVVTLGVRLYRWLLAILQGRPAIDPVATFLFWLLVLTGASVWASWGVSRRQQPLLGMLPGLLLLALLLSSSSAAPVYLALTLLPLLLLKATSAHTQRERQWRERGIQFSSRFGRDRTRTAAGIALGLALIALILPSISVYRLLDNSRDPGRQERQREVARSLGLEVPLGSASKDPFLHQRQGGLPASHLVGSGPELSQQPVMAITILHPAEPNAERRYWRALTYDRYDGRGWETRGTITISYPAGESVDETPPNTMLIRQEVEPLTPLEPVIFAAGQPLSVDRRFQVAWRGRLRGTEIYVDPFAAAVVAESGRSYRVDSLLPVYDQSVLRASPFEIPQWIAEHYLSLPDAVSDRVRALAVDLTATEPTPYDRALAIEEHLRQYPYTLDLPAPPAGMEIADYFLFELQRGYCDYYATTMVVLARASGLPARLATGYVGGSFDEAKGRYLVTADLAHSWPELYFSDYGWIPFEPTAGRARLRRAADVQVADRVQPETGLEPITAARSRARWTALGRLAAAVSFIVAGTFLAWWLLDLWRLRWLSPSRVLWRLFSRMRGAGRYIGIRPGAGETPYEFSLRLGRRLQLLSAVGWGAASLASAPAAVDRLTRLYTRERYSRFQPDRSHQSEAIRAWTLLCFQLWWAAILYRLQTTAARSSTSR